MVTAPSGKRQESVQRLAKGPPHYTRDSFCYKSYCHEVNTNTFLGNDDEWVKTIAKRQTCRHALVDVVEDVGVDVVEDVGVDVVEEVGVDVVEDVGVGAEKLITRSQNV